MGLDLQAKRRERSGFDTATGRATRTFPITFGDDVIAELGPEFPLTALAPLQQVIEPLSLLVMRAVEATRSGYAELPEPDEDATADERSAYEAEVARRSSETTLDVIGNVVQVLVLYPSLVKDSLDAVMAVARELLGEDGLAKLTAIDPSPADLTVLVNEVARWYGVALGESAASSSSSGIDGATSTPTSALTTAASTSTPSGSTRRKKAS